MAHGRAAWFVASAPAGKRVAQRVAQDGRATRHRALGHKLWHGVEAAKCCPRPQAEPRPGPRKPPTGADVGVRRATEAGTDRRRASAAGQFLFQFLPSLSLSVSLLPPLLLLFPLSPHGLAHRRASVSSVWGVLARHGFCAFAARSARVRRAFAAREIFCDGSSLGQPPKVGWKAARRGTARHGRACRLGLVCRIWFRFDLQSKQRGHIAFRSGASRETATESRWRDESHDAKLCRELLWRASTVR